MRFLLYKWKVFNQEDIKAALERAGHEVHVFNAVDFVREKQEEIEEGLLNQIASVLGISAEVIKDFDVEKAIYNINNIRDNTFEQGSTSIAQQFNPVDKIVELYERLLQSEREKVELLKNK